MIFDLTHTDEFPDPRYGDQSGFYAVGGELSPERLAKAYPMGIFPYFAYKLERICWWAPHERFVIYPSEIHVSHSMRNMMNKGRYRCTIGEDFAGVLAGCATIDGRIDEDNAWLGPELIDIWMDLHDMGHAQSVEVWDGDELVGGLYGFVCGAASLGTACSRLFRAHPNWPSSTLPVICRNKAGHSSTASWRLLISSQWEHATYHMKSS